MLITLSYRSAHAKQFFMDVLGVKRAAAAKIITKLLHFEQKQGRMDIAREMLTTFNDNPDLLKKVTTGEDGYDIKTKASGSV